MTVWPLSVDSVTVNVAGVVPVFPSATVCVADDRLGQRVVVDDRGDAVAVEDPCVDGVFRSTEKVSLLSGNTSPWTRIVTSAVVSPAAKVAMPEAAA